MEVLRLKENDMVMDYGEIGTKFYIVMEGQVSIFVPKPIEFKVEIKQNLFKRQSVLTSKKGMISDDESEESHLEIDS